MFRKARTWFIIEALILFAHPFLMMYHFHIASVRFEAERAKNPGVMGDCSGMSTIIPLLICVWMILFFLWSFIMIFVVQHISKTAALVQIILIMALAVIPSLWLYLLLIID